MFPIYIYIPDANHGASIFTYNVLAHKNMGLQHVGVHIPAPWFAAYGTICDWRIIPIITKSQDAGGW